MRFAVRVVMTPYPVQLEVSSPLRFDRMQLLVRLALGIALGWLGITLGWLWSFAFVVLPVLAAVAISSGGSRYYQDALGPKIWRALSWFLAFSAYLLLVTDRLPTDEQPIRAELSPTGKPTIGSALLRLILSIPSAIALCFVGFVSCVFWAIGVFTILLSQRVPPSIVEFQTGFLRWQARLLAYHASLVEEYPPFSFGDRDRAPTGPAATVQS
jgi:hypothetical protein